MTAKEYLKRVKLKTEQIQEQIDYIRRLRDTLDVAGVSYDKEPVQGSHVSDKVNQIILQIIDEEHNLEVMRNELIDLRLDTVNTISKLDNELQRKVLNIVYVDLKPMKDCAVELNYSYDHIRGVHVNALNNLSTVINSISDE